MRSFLALFFLLGMAWAAPTTTTTPLRTTPSEQRNRSSVAAPLPCSPANVSLCLNSLRDKQMRLQSIKDYVLNTLGRGKVPSPNSLSPLPQSTPFSGEIKNYVASCDVPHRVNLEEWRNPSNFHLFFNLSQNHTPKNESNSTSSRPTTISAKLKLYKKPFTLLMNEFLINDTTNSLPLLPLPQEKLRVSLYWYKAPFTSTHYKKKFIDKKTINLGESGWVEFDLLDAAQMWLNQRNFGLVVEVENEDNFLLDAEEYFENTLCQDFTGNNTNITSPLVMHPPQLEICLLNTPHPLREVQSTKSPPPSYPEGFNHLTRIAQTHQWQNDDLAPPPRKYKLRRKGKKVPSSTMSTLADNFHLDEDHPLRRILATAATNVRGQDEEEEEEEHSLEGGDVFIEKIYIAGGVGVGGDLQR